MTWQMMTWQDADWQAFKLADTWTNGFLTRGIFCQMGMVPRGPGMGCHVAPVYVCKIIMESMGIRTLDLHTYAKLLAKAGPQPVPTLVLNIYMC
jgi:hypothetical protein